MGKLSKFVLLVLLGLVPAVAHAQEPARITGRVLDPAGAPISGANVFIRSLNIGAVTQENGAYTLTVPASRVISAPVQITAQAPARQTQTASVTLRPGASLTQDFRLGLDVLELEGIVATGQGTQTTRERAAATINTVRSTEIERSQEVNIVSALAGKAPGVNVTSTSGDPGSGAQIRIRGAASIVGGTQPLFVVDGTPISNETDQIETYSTTGTALQNRAMDINPADIESIDILKGAAATAIYGSRGANGVIIVKTKEGRAGQARATFSTSYGRDNVTNLPELQQEFGQTPGSFTSWGPRLAEGTPVFDHAGELFEAGNRLETNVSVSGGSERTTYFLSVGRLDHNGTIVGSNDQYARTTARLKGTHYLLDDLQVSGNFAFTDSDARYVQQGSNLSGIFLGGLRTPPEWNNLPYLDPGTGLHRTFRCNEITGVCPGGGRFTNVGTTRGYDNPFFVINEQRNTADVGRGFGNVGIDYTPTPWLRASYLLGYDHSTDDRLTLRPKSTSDSSGADGDIIRATIIREIVDSNLSLTATGAFGESFTGSLTAGQNLNQELEDWNQANGNNIILGAGQTDFAVDLLGNEYTAKVRTDGYFLTGEGTLFDQLTLTATGRWDGSSTFGGEDNRFFYPGVGASWVFSDSPVLGGFNLLDFGKLRASWGVSGRRPPVFSNVSAFETGTYLDGWINTGLNTIYLGNEGLRTEETLGNPDIRPERKTEWEAGVDLAFFDSRVSLGATYYDRFTEDAILQLPVALSTGFADRWANAAEISNNGWELTADINPLRMRNANWSISANWATNNSCVENLAGAEDESLGGFTTPYAAVVAPERDEAGNITRCHPFGVLFGGSLVRFGNDINVRGIGNIDEAFPDAPEGALFIGADGFPIRDPQFRVLGDPNPDWTAGIRNTLTLFDNLTISGLVDISRGGDMYNGTRSALEFFGTSATTLPYHGEGKKEVFGRNGWYDQFEVAGPGAGKEVVINNIWFQARPGTNFTGNNLGTIEDASFVKLRDVSVSYTLAEQNWLDRVGFSSLNLTLSGRNLKTWTDYTGIDPESSLVGSQFSALGLDYFNNPQTRSYIVTVNLNR